MKVPPSAQAIIATVLIALGGLAAACGGAGDGALRLEEYFQRLDELEGELEERSGDISAQAEGLSEEEMTDQAPDLLGDQSTALHAFLDNLAELEPPEEAANLHEEVVQAMEGFVELFDEALDVLKEADSLDDPFAPFETGELEAAGTRIDRVCVEVEQLAAENGIDIDLNCEEDE